MEYVIKYRHVLTRPFEPRHLYTPGTRDKLWRQLVACTIIVAVIIFYHQGENSLWGITATLRITVSPGHRNFPVSGGDTFSRLRVHSNGSLYKQLYIGVKKRPNRRSSVPGTVVNFVFPKISYIIYEYFILDRQCIFFSNICQIIGFILKDNETLRRFKQNLYTEFMYQWYNNVFLSMNSLGIKYNN